MILGNIKEFFLGSVERPQHRIEFSREEIGLQAAPIVDAHHTGDEIRSIRNQLAELSRQNKA